MKYHPAVEDMIARRMKNTGETRAEAIAAIKEVKRQIDGGELVCDVVDDNGKVVGYRDAKGYHEYN